MNKVVYISGVQGVGKSTLIKEMCQRDSSITRYQKIVLPKLESIEERQIGRLTRSYLHHFFIRELPGVVIADRCSFDGIAYARAFRKLGWVDETYVAKIEELHSTLFCGSVYPQNFVLLDPPVDFVKENLARRWETGRKKWREDDFAYLLAAKDEYRNLCSELSCNVLVVEEKNLEHRVKILNEWVRS